MLRYFSVSGYKNFDQLIELDFSSVRDYKFSTDCINDGLLGKMIIYGKNAVGKSNFARALFDIFALRMEMPNIMKSGYYLNVNNTRGYAEFRYIFQFGSNTVEYQYRKTSLLELVYEKILINEELLVEFDRQRPHDLKTPELHKLAPTLVLEFDKIKSVLTYIVSNTPLNTDHPLRKTIEFIQHIHLDISGEYIDAASDYDLKSIISDRKRLDEFEELLHIAGITENLTVVNEPTGSQMLCFDTDSPLPFHYVASSGTKTLCSIFALYHIVKNSGSHHLFIMDEFDTFYHYELAEYIVKMFLALPNVQVVFTSHNTSLLTNRYMRPDCCFIMTKNKLTALPNATNMELREGHNLQKLFIGGEFDE